MTSADLSTISPASQLAARVALLDAAERLFSQNGIEGTSVRDIIKAAGANLGAINYHFGTKDRLALEVFARRIEPVNRERIARLDALEAGVGRRKLKLEEILDALIRPALESEEQGAKNCDDFMRLISRSFQEPNAEVKKFVEQQFAEVAHRFDSAILRGCRDCRRRICSGVCASCAGRCTTGCRRGCGLTKCLMRCSTRQR